MAARSSLRSDLRLESYREWIGKVQLRRHHLERRFASAFGVLKLKRRSEPDTQNLVDVIRFQWISIHFIQHSCSPKTNSLARKASPKLSGVRLWPRRCPRTLSARLVPSTAKLFRRQKSCAVAPRRSGPSGEQGGTSNVSSQQMSCCHRERMSSAVFGDAGMPRIHSVTSAKNAVAGHV